MENEKNLEEVQEEVIPSEETAPAEETPVEETVSAEQTAEEEAVSAEEEATSAEEEPAAEAPAEAGEEAAPAEEAVPAEEPAAEEPKTEEKKVTPAKMALLVGAIVVVAAIIVALLVSGKKTEPQAGESQAAPEAGQEMTVPETVPEPTVPADGNPDDETCKGSYTVNDVMSRVFAKNVVATLGEHTLTNRQLQVFYWMQVQNFLSSDYGSYMMYYGMLDLAQPLDTQVCTLTGTGTWQQFFLKEALTTWRNYCILFDKAKEAELELDKESKEYLDTLEENLASAAQYYGMESGEEFLHRMLGASADMASYRYFQELLGYGNLYYDAEHAKLTVTLEEMEAYFAEHEAELAENGITREGFLVDVRHVLFTPEGGTTDEAGATTYSESAWAACEANAQNVLNAWTKKGDLTEESFASLAATYSQDPGSSGNGGLYEGVYQGQMVPEFDAWCFDENRKPGHYGMVKTSYGYHLMYFVDRVPVWQDHTEKVLMAEKEENMMKTLVDAYPMEVDYSNIFLGHVALAG